MNKQITRSISFECPNAFPEAGDKTQIFPGKHDTFRNAVFPSISSRPKSAKLTIKSKLFFNNICQPTLISVSAKGFYKSQHVIDFLCETLGVTVQNLDDHRFQLDKRKLEKAINGMNTFRSLAIAIAITGGGHNNNIHIWTLSRTL